MIDPKKTVMIVVDMQNDFLGVGRGYGNARGTSRKSALWRLLPACPSLAHRRPLGLQFPPDESSKAVTGRLVSANEVEVLMRDDA